MKLRANYSNIQYAVIQVSSTHYSPELVVLACASDHPTYQKRHHLC
jgi:hypothetical protein